MKKGLHYIIETIWVDLQEAKKQQDKKRFDRLLLDALPEIKKYTATRLNRLVAKGKIPEGKYSPSDFISELYLKAYKQVHLFQEPQAFSNWLFITTDTMLDDTVIKEEKRVEMFENIDEIGKVERETMEEEFSTDGDGDLMMLEEFDDPSYPDFEYTLDRVFIDNQLEPSLIEKLNKEFTADQLHDKIDAALNEMDDDKRIVFELSTIFHVAPEHITSIRNVTITEIESIKTEVQEHLVKSLNK